MPSAVMGVVLVAGCVAWGAIAPSAPPGWDKPGEHIIVDSDSTTRYVVLADKNGKHKQLHPVLNFASAKLVLDKGKGDVIEVAGKHIDASSIARGATIGIPYAPDRLPSAEDAGAPKEWAVCEKPGATAGGAPQQGVFVMGGQDRKALKNKNRLHSGQALYVEDSSTGDQYVVDSRGTKLSLGGPAGKLNRSGRDLLARFVLKNPGKPQKVSSEWLKTLNEGEYLQFPKLDASRDTPPAFDGLEALPAEARKIGTVLESAAGGTHYFYVVRKDGVEQISPLVAKLYIGELNLKSPTAVTQLEVSETHASNEMNMGGRGWPMDSLVPVNREADGLGSAPRDVSCSVYTGSISGGKPKLAAWAGRDYPANLVEGSASAYVSSGSGLLYSEVSGKGGGGTQYLLTDSGLRYALRGGSGEGQDAGGTQKDGARARLGYEKAKVAKVPQTWSSLLPKGPSLDTTSASQEQGM